MLTDMMEGNVSGTLEFKMRPSFCCGRPIVENVSWDEIA